MVASALVNDLKSLACELLEKEKKLLLDEKDEYAVAAVVVITQETRYWEEAKFNDADEKSAIYADIVRRANENRAIAIITVNSSYEKPVNGSEELANYRWGDLSASESQRAITITISGAGIAPCSMSLPYCFESGSVTLGEPTAFEPAVIDLLPDWPQLLC
jgi:hypothetical protein